jgi:hypothetical protein
MTLYNKLTTLYYINIAYLYLIIDIFFPFIKINSDYIIKKLLYTIHYIDKYDDDINYTNKKLAELIPKHIEKKRNFDYIINFINIVTNISLFRENNDLKKNNEFIQDAFNVYDNLFMDYSEHSSDSRSSMNSCSSMTSESSITDSDNSNDDNSDDDNSNDDNSDDDNSDDDNSDNDNSDDDNSDDDNVETATTSLDDSNTENNIMDDNNHIDDNDPKTFKDFLYKNKDFLIDTCNNIEDKLNNIQKILNNNMSNNNIM